MENQSTGGLVKKGDMRQVATYALSEEPGMRTINTVIKDGVAMVAIVELAGTMDLKLNDRDSCYNLT